MQTAPAQRVGWGRMRLLCRWGWSIGTAAQCSQGKLVPKQSVPIGQEECPNLDSTGLLPALAKLPLRFQSFLK
jgi:hypothetical protein